MTPADTMELAAWRACGFKNPAQAARVARVVHGWTCERCDDEGTIVLAVDGLMHECPDCGGRGGREPLVERLPDWSQAAAEIREALA